MESDAAAVALFGGGGGGEGGGVGVGVGANCEREEGVATAVSLSSLLCGAKVFSMLCGVKVAGVAGHVVWSTEEGNVWVVGGEGGSMLSLGKVLEVRRAGPLTR